MKSFRFSSNTSARLLKASLAAMLSFSGFSSSTILAEEETEQPEEIVSEEVSEEVPEEVSEEPEEILEEAAAAEGRIITEAEKLSVSEIRKETRLAMEEILAELPATIRVRIAENEMSEGEWTEIPANWKCVDDYTQDRSIYYFVPAADGYTVLLDADLPYVKLVVGDPEDALTGGVHAITRQYEIPDSVFDGSAKANLPAAYNTLSMMPPVRDRKSVV